MIRITDFPRIVYKKPKIYRFEKPLVQIYGFDSEAYTDGTTFLYCTSEGDAFTPDNLLDNLFSEKYQSSNFVVWNLKYEAGAILRIFPKATLQLLQRTHRAFYYHNNVKLEIRYIPHKRLSIRQCIFGGRSVRFWDISPFYGRIKLNTASKAYLNEQKIDTDTEEFTRPYVLKHFSSIVKYCVQDAVLTKKLAVLWIEKFEQTGIQVTSLYSEASISFRYFSKKTDIVVPYEYWKTNKRLLRYAFESYEGGKFEIIARGKFSGYEYDISSAYPYEISNLVDIRGAEIIYSKKYVHEAYYAFIRVHISFSDPTVHLPCGMMQKVRVYPMGSYYLTITKQEYDYITQELPQVKVTIIDGAWMVIRKIRYSYRSIIMDLYNLKQEWKPKDRLVSNNYKVIMNGFYGKTAQCISQPDGHFHAGIGWNPIYASIITANTRIAVTRMQNLFKHACLAVHTDSVITTVRMPPKFLQKALGGFELVEEGQGVLVACGVYEINGEPALKGWPKRRECEHYDPSTSLCSVQGDIRKDFKCKEYDVKCKSKGWIKNSIIYHLDKNPGHKKIRLPVIRAESWMQSMAQNHGIDSINLFSKLPKDLQLNCDTKRIWPNDVTSNDLLRSLQYSAPLIEMQNTLPKHWR